MPEKKGIHPIVLVFSILIPLAVLFWWFALYGNDMLTDCGSDTEYGAVYRTKYQGHTVYQWYIFEKDNSVKDYGISAEKPYIYQDGDGICLMLQGDYHGNDTPVEVVNYSFGKEETEFLSHNLYDRPEHSNALKVGNNRPKTIETGVPYVEVVDYSLYDVPLFLWTVYDTDGEIIWDGEAKYFPQFVMHDNIVTLRYQEDGLNLYQEFYPEESDFSHSYSLYENDSIYVEHLMDWLPTPWIPPYDNSIAQNDGFVNVDSTEIVGVDEAFQRAKSEVSIPYSLVTFRVITDISNEDCPVPLWEVTFSQRDDPNGAVQTVYMDGNGITLLILNGKPKK